MKIALSAGLPWPDGRTLPSLATGERARRMRFSITCVSTWLHTSCALGMFWQRGSAGAVFVALLRCARAGPASQHINTSSSLLRRLIFSSQKHFLFYTHIHNTGDMMSERDRTASPTLAHRLRVTAIARLHVPLRVYYSHYAINISKGTALLAPASNMR